MKLDDYLKENNISARQFAGSINRAPSTVTRILRGETRPDWPTIAAIEKETGGRVTANDFMAAA